MKLNKPILYSIAIHAVILLIFAFIKISSRPKPPEEKWVEVQTLPTTVIRKPAPKPALEKTKAGKKPLKTEEKTPEEKLVEERIRQEMLAKKEIEKKEKEIAQQLFGNKSVNVKIEGIISQRRLINYVLPPRLPLLSDVTIKVRVTVDPQGYVKRVEFVKKGDPNAERSIRSILYQWRFEPLKKGIKPHLEEGIITFHFVVGP